MVIVSAVTLLLTTVGALLAVVSPGAVRSWLRREIGVRLSEAMAFAALLFVAAAANLAGGLSEPGEPWLWWLRLVLTVAVLPALFLLVVIGAARKQRAKQSKAPEDRPFPDDWLSHD